jgi:hypothetical protein
MFAKNANKYKQSGRKQLARSKSLMDQSRAQRNGLKKQIDIIQQQMSDMET